jgi:hypothetical protein
VISADSAKGFLDSLSQKRSSLQMIVTFTHGQSGTIVDANGRISEDVAGPRLLFSDTGALNVGDLNTLLSNLPLE